jgi:hypothetical protein
MMTELQCSAVLSYDANDLFWHAGHNVRLDFQCNGDFRTNQSGQMRNDFVGNPASISSDASRIDSYAAVKPPWLRRRVRERRNGR